MKYKVTLEIQRVMAFVYIEADQLFQTASDRLVADTTVVIDMPGDIVSVVTDTKPGTKNSKEGMTVEEMNIALAEHIGLTVIQCPFVPNKVRTATSSTVFTAEALRQWRLAYPGGGGVKGLPDYDSLDAIRVVENTLTMAQDEFYRGYLQGKAGFYTYHRASAAVRRECLCRALFPKRWPEPNGRRK